MRHILFMCVANSARSQMAEGIARSLVPDGVTVYSAGSEPSRVNPFAVKAMAEIGLDISHHTSKGVEAIPVDKIDTVVTLCAEEVCPVFPGDVKRIHLPMPDPASAGQSDHERLAAFRSVRDIIREQLANILPKRQSQ